MNAQRLAVSPETAAYLSIIDAPDLEPGFTAMARFRFEVEQEIERLLTLLDDMDGDPDSEQTATETHGLGFAFDPSFDCAEAA